MRPSCRLTRTVLSLRPFFSLSLFYVTRIVSDEFCVNDYGSLSWNQCRCCFCRLAVLRRLADRQGRSLHGNHSVLRITGIAATFFPLGFSSLSSFVTRTAWRHDIASFHLQPHPLIPLVGVARNSSVPCKKIDVHWLCRLGATFFSNFQWNRANKLESWMELTVGKEKYVPFNRSVYSIFLISGCIYTFVAKYIIFSFVSL